MKVDMTLPSTSCPSVNPLNPALGVLYARLNMANGLLYSLESHLSNFRKMMQERIDKGEFDPEGLFVGTILAVSDITESPTNGWRHFSPSGKFAAGGRDYLDLVDRFVQRESAWCCSQGYEFFETYLYDAATTYLMNEASNIDRKWFKDCRASISSREDTRNCLRKTCQSKNNHKILESLRGICPEIKDAETANDRRLNLRDWYEVVSEVRHATTHANLLVKSSQISDWPAPKKNLLTTLFPCEKQADGLQLKINRAEAEACLCTFAEYGFQIFKFLSKKAGYDWHILRSTNHEKPKHS